MEGRSLPPGWIETLDPKTGKKYYTNLTTKESSWEFPAFPPASNGASLHSSKKSSLTFHDLSSSRGSSFFSAPKNNMAWDNPSKLIPMTRLMLDKRVAFPKETENADIEMLSITPGQIADLCKIQHRTHGCGPNVAYNPLNPYRMSIMSEIEPIEEARMDARMSSLIDDLAKYGYRANS
jgi:hypothetical protein